MSEQESDQIDTNCPTCGYSLRGRVSTRCPECGNPTAPQETGVAAGPTIGVLVALAFLASLHEVAWESTGLFGCLILLIWPFIAVVSLVYLFALAVARIGRQYRLALSVAFIGGAIGTVHYLWKVLSQVASL